jgi:phage terminase large subunit-like protein
MIGIESVQYQISLIQMARKQHLPIKELKPDKDKVSRCLPMVSLLEAGKVFFYSDEI